MITKETFLLWGVDVGTTLKCVNTKLSHKIKLFLNFVIFLNGVGNLCKHLF